MHLQEVQLRERHREQPARVPLQNRLGALLEEAHIKTVDVGVRSARRECAAYAPCESRRGGRPGGDRRPGRSPAACHTNAAVRCPRGIDGDASPLRAHRALQNAPTRFAQRPQAITRGHFYFVENGDISISR